MAAPKPFIPYVRVSRVGGRDERDGYISIPVQVKKIRALGKALGVPVDEEVFRDENRSGTTTNREEFQRALGMVKRGERAGILVATMDRFSRDTVDAITLIREVEAAEGKIGAADAGRWLSVANGQDEFVTTLQFAVSTFDGRRRSDYLSETVETAISRGIHLNNPFGYQKGPGKRLVPNLREAPAVVRMYELRAEGLSWNRIAEHLNSGGYARPRPYKRHKVVRQAQWTGKAVLQIVRREVYLGTAHNGPHRHVGAHEPLVSLDLWKRANRTKGTKPVGAEEGYLLSGLVRCASCGYVMTHAPSTKQGRRYYRCRSAQHGAGRCPAPVNVNAEQLEAFVEDEFRRRYLSPDIVLVPEADEGELDAALLKISNAEVRFQAALRAKIDLGEKPSKRELKIAEDEVAAARDYLAQAETDLQVAQMAARGADLPPMLTEIVYATAGLEEKRHFLSLVFRCVAVRPARAWREPVPARARIISPDDAPAESVRLIPYVAALDW